MAASTAAARRLDAWVLAAAALAAYVLLGQQCLYNRDAHVLLVRIAEGQALHNHHLTYFPVVHAVHALGAPLGLTLFESARLASALGTALGVAFVHHACRRLGLDRGQAALTAGLVALCPAVAFFATVVEVHGPFFAAAGLACWAAAWFAAAPGPGTALGLGAALGLASCAHSTAHLMAAALLSVVWVRARRDHPARAWRSHGMLLVGAVAVQAVVVAAVPALLGLDASARQADAAALVDQHLTHLTGRPAWGWDLPGIALVELWQEWLWPMLPLSALLLAGLFRDRLRLETAAVLAGLLPYLALVVAVLSSFRGASEHGAYLLPLVWPAALVTAAAWPRRVTHGVLALSAVLALTQIGLHDDPAPARAYAAGLRELAGDHEPYLLVGDYADLEALHVQLPGVAYALVTEYVGLTPADRVPALNAMIDLHIERRQAAGGRVYLTDATERFLADPTVGARAPAAPALLAHLRTRYSLERCAAQGFAGWWLRPRG